MSLLAREYSRELQKHTVNVNLSDSQHSFRFSETHESTTEAHGYETRNHARSVTPSSDILFVLSN